MVFSSTFLCCGSGLYVNGKGVHGIPGCHFLHKPFAIPQPLQVVFTAWIWTVPFPVQSGHHIPFRSHYRLCGCSCHCSGKKTKVSFFFNPLVFGQPHYWIICYRAWNYFWTPNLPAVHVFLCSPGRCSVQIVQCGQGCFHYFWNPVDPALFLDPGKEPGLERPGSILEGQCTKSTDFLSCL